jgi:amino acid adenylation domain-containing protein
MTRHSHWLLKPPQWDKLMNQESDHAHNSKTSNVIHALFERQARRAPGAIAVISDDQELSYAQLNDRANHVAHTLLVHGIEPEQRVALYADRSLEMVVGMLATLKAGGAYVPLDPSYPAERLEFIRDDSHVSLVLTTKHWLPRAICLERPTILLDDEHFVEMPAGARRAASTSANLAYVIYTSGSTGNPKGVMVEHRNVVGMAVNTSYAPLSPEDCVAHCGSPSFDATTWEVWAPLLNGARLLIVPQSVVLSAAALNNKLIRHKVTAMWLTVGLFNSYVDALADAFGSLRFLLVGGDALTPAVIARALGKPVPPHTLVNMYGPTETTTFASSYAIAGVAVCERALPIGQPITNCCMYVLTDNGQVATDNATGEICIGGSGVARGYQNQPALTAERFVAAPLGAIPGNRMYRTGDSGRWQPDGNLAFLGRNDDQVKIRGFRIELGEIERALLSYPGVVQAIVVVVGDNPIDKRLRGYVKGDPSWDKQSQQARIQEHLRERIPGYMVPAKIYILDEFPLTPNGKVDRRSLPTTESRPQLRQPYVPAGSPAEDALCRIWAHFLKVDQIGVRDDFFELGGDSLSGLALVASVEDALRIQLPPVTVFQYSTVEKMAKLIEPILASSAGSTQYLRSGDAAPLGTGRLGQQ